MPPKHAFLFDLPLRYVLGTGVAAGTLWTLFKPTDVALAEEVSQKPKVLVRTPATRASPSAYPYPEPNPHRNLILSSPSPSPSPSPYPSPYPRPHPTPTKVLVRTASGAVRSSPAIPLPRAAAPPLARRALWVIPA